MTRLSDRLDRAIYRASVRFFATFVFRAGNGFTRRLDAVKRTVGLDELAVTSGNLSARSVEFVVSRKTFNDMIRVAAFGSPSDGPRAALREARIEEICKDGRVLSYGFNPARPYDENSPDSGTIRLYCTLKTEA